MMDNARIYRANKIIKLIKEIKLIVFIIQPYSPGLNKVGYSFDILKNKSSFKMWALNN